MKIAISNPTYNAAVARLRVGMQLICNLDKEFELLRTQTDFITGAVTYFFNPDLSITFTPENDEEMQALKGFQYVQCCKGQFSFLYIKRELFQKEK